MHVQDQAAQTGAEHSQKHVVIHKPGGEGEAGPGPAGAQGHIPGQNRQKEEAAPHHQGDAPVDHNGDGAAGEDALAPLEVEHAGEHVSQQAPQAAPVLRQGICSAVHLYAPQGEELPGEPHGHFNGHHRLEHIAQDDHKGERAAEGAVEVGEARVPAAVVAHIVPQDILGDDHRPVEAAAEVGDRRCHQGREPQVRPIVGQKGKRTLHPLTPPFRPSAGWSAARGCPPGRRWHGSGSPDTAGRRSGTALRRCRSRRSGGA